jgi:type I restriction enzyme S subunit
MRKGHRRLSISDLCHFINGNGFRPSDWKTSGTPIIRIQNLNGSQSFNYYDGPIKDDWVVEREDLLYAWAGVKGVSFGPTVWTGPRGVLNQHIYKVIPGTGVDRYWLFLALKFVTGNIESRAHGFKSSLVHVHKEDITGQIVEVPPVEEQRKIAAALRTWDESIEKSEQIIQKLIECRNALSSRLLSEGHRKGHPIEFGEILKESRIAGSDGSSARKITVKLYGKGALEKSENYSGSVNTRYYIREKGQLIYSKLDFLNGAFAIIPDSLDGFETTLDLPAFDISPEVNSAWLIEYLTRPSYYTKQVSLARGQRKARRIPPEEFLNSKVRLPDRNTQDRLAKILSDADEEISLAKERQNAHERQKRGLMQRLLTGEWRVKL